MLVAINVSRVLNVYDLLLIVELNLNPEGKTIDVGIKGLTTYKLVIAQDAVLDLTL